MNERTDKAPLSELHQSRSKPELGRAGPQASEELRQDLGERPLYRSLAVATGLLDHRQVASVFTGDVGVHMRMLGGARAEVQLPAGRGKALGQLFLQFRRDDMLITVIDEIARENLAGQNGINDGVVDSFIQEHRSIGLESGHDSGICRNGFHDVWKLKLNLKAKI